MKVLVVEDDPSLQAMMIDMLSDNGHDATATDSAPEAIALMETKPFDVVVTDYNLTRGNGHQVAEAAKKQNPARRVILASSDMEDPGKADMLLPKPYRYYDLLCAVEG